MSEPQYLPMKWTIDCDDSKKVLRATVSGQMMAEGILAMATDLLEASRTYGVHLCLCDCRNVSLKINFSEIYDLPNALRALGVNARHYVALVYSASHTIAPLFTFFGDRAFNTGLSQKTFPDYEQATRWLDGIAQSMART